MGKDYTERRQFACMVKRTYPEDFFQSHICFYVDGVSFHHKTTRKGKGQVWRKCNEKRCQFARMVKRTYTEDFFQSPICF